MVPHVQSASLKLPDGWYGTPYDHLHGLTYLESRPHKVLLEFDRRLPLVFTELGAVRVETTSRKGGIADLTLSDLVLSDFSQLVSVWEEAEPTMPHARIYLTGEARLSGFA